VGGDEQHAAGALVGGGEQRGLVDSPARGLVEQVGAQLQAAEGREVLEERVGDVRRQQVVARVGEQGEEQAVRLAGAGGDEDLVDAQGQRRRPAGVVGDDRRPRRQAAPRVGLVAPRGPEALAGGPQDFGGEDQALAGGVAAGEVDVAARGGAALPGEL
jgi:hypothetical protein